MLGLVKTLCAEQFHHNTKKKKKRTQNVSDATSTMCLPTISASFYTAVVPNSHCVPGDMGLGHARVPLHIPVSPCGRGPSVFASLCFYGTLQQEKAQRLQTRRTYPSSSALGK